MSKHYATRLIKLQSEFNLQLQQLNKERNARVKIKQMQKFFDFLHDRHLTSIKEVDYKLMFDFIDQIKAEPNERTGEAKKGGTVNKYIDLLHNFSEYLGNTYEMELPMLIEFEPVLKEKPVILTELEILAMYDGVDSGTALELRDRAILHALYSAGMRRNEAYYLDCDHIHTDNKQVYVEHGKTGPRCVTVPARVIEEINEYIYDSREELINKGNESALFISHNRFRLSAESIYSRVQEMAKNSGLQSLQDKQFGCHDLRHSSATHLYSRGVSLYSIKEFLGHKSIESTQIYIQILKEIQEEQA